MKEIPGQITLDDFLAQLGLGGGYGQ